MNTSVYCLLQANKLVLDRYLGVVDTMTLLECLMLKAERLEIYIQQHINHHLLQLDLLG